MVRDAGLVEVEARDLAGLGRDFGGGLTEAEVVYLRDQEWARTADDVLWRRSKLGLHVPAGTREAHRGVRIADGEPVAVRPTRGGDAWAARHAGARGEGSAGRPPGGNSRAGVLLGMPALSRPA